MRTTMKRALSWILAAAAAVLLVCPAAAASSPWLLVEDKGTNTQPVSLQGLSGRYTSVQITLKLSSVPAGLSFIGALSDEQTYSTSQLSGDSLTIYVTSKAMLNQDSTLALGTLTADESFTVVSASGLKLLNVGPDDTQTLTYSSVSLSGSGSSTPSRYSVSAAAGISGGSLQISATHARRGETVTVTALPDPDYVLRGLTVTDRAGRKISVTDLGDGKWSFVMPSSAVTVNASFVPEGAGQLPFGDVGENDWFREAVAYVYDAGLMSGTDGDRFSPNGTTTRGMIVTILYRYEGSPAAGTSDFRDVAPGQYYAEPVAWAAASGVVNGYDGGLFGPERMITREQMAAILFRYAQYKGLDVSGRADLSGYSDAGQISGYAADAMSWASQTGLITGVDEHTLLPGGSATRAQVATILMRFCQFAQAQ